MKEKGSQFGGRPYYHGTGGGIDGGVVEPRPPTAYSRSLPVDDPLRRPAAYATTNLGAAGVAAGHKASDEGRLFGSVYEVEPKVVVGTDGPDKYGVPSPTGAIGHIADPEGLDVVKHTGFFKRNGDKL